MFHIEKKLLIIIFIITKYSVAFANTAESKINKELASVVSNERLESGVVSLGAVFSKNNYCYATAVSGERKIDSKVFVTSYDKWHLGSVTKSITATMIARLVEQRILNWDTKVGDIFKDNQISDTWKDVTLEMLLTHTSGAQSDFPWSIQSLHPTEGAQRQSLRKKEVLKILAVKPEDEPGTNFNYSNVGYTIAGVMASIRTGKSWEDLIREEIFQPLQLTSGGFGPPLDIDNTLTQPRGHKKSWFSGPVAVSTHTDNSPIMGPAGSIHISLKDLSTYANDHVLGSEGLGKLLSQETYIKLHKVGLGDYAYGWIAAKNRSWADGHSVLYHNGTNTFWYSLLVIIPELQISVAVTSNDGNYKVAGKSAWNIVKHMTAFVLNNGCHDEQKPTKDTTIV